MIHGDAGWLGWCSTIDRARAAAEAALEEDAVEATVHGGEAQGVVRVTGSDASLVVALREYCDVALYRTATRRVLRHARTWSLGQVTPGVTMLFTIHRRPQMTPDAFHQWWEQSHAPIALRHHVGMWDYAQVSVIDTLHGDPWDGFAVTQWPTLDDLMHRFSSGPDGTEALRNDAAQFTDPSTLQRHLMDESVIAEPANASWGEQPVGLARSIDVDEATPVHPGDLPDGMTLEIRSTADGRPRRDVLWRTVAAAATLDAVGARFDEWCRRLGYEPQPSSSS